jgi:GTP-binding protein EngB required for normal cell division
MAGRGLALLSRKDETGHLVERVRALRDAVELCDGRVSEPVLAEAQRVVAQTDRRLAISGGATVVALAGATGSGKSSLFNALSGTTLAKVGVRRPTTSHALACSWGDETAAELLDWLEIPRRHALERDPAAAALDGLVLVDLPDHDSTELSHRLEVDRLVQLVDMLVWVVDPQKYADAALHDRYLKPLAQHAEVMMVVLNQADRLSPAERDQCIRDLKRLLGSEGIAGVDVLPVSAVTGEGIETLRAKLAKAVAAKKAAARRLAADVGVVTERLSSASGTVKAVALGKQSLDRMNRSLAEAAGVGVVTEAVGKAWRLRGGLATGWPVLAWLAKFRPDPLRRLHLDRLGTGRRRRKEIDPSRVGRTSLPATSGVQQARVESAIRALADETAEGLSRGWADAVKEAARSSQDVLPDTLDRAIATTDLDLAGHRGWWQAVRVLQWLLVAAVVVGLGWLGSAFVLAYLQLPPLPRVTWWGLPAPTVLAVGGVLAGLVLAGLARIGVEVGARRRALNASRALGRSIARVTNELVVAPVEAERERYEKSRVALERAHG